MRRVLLGFAVGTALSGGCATDEYVYRPTEQATATTEGHVTARYPVPPEQPRGEVYLTSFGPSEAEIVKGQKVELLHVRMVVNNNNAPGAWTVNPTEQMAIVPGLTTIGPAYVNARAATSQQLAVPPSGRQVLDLYYQLPPGFGPKRLSNFEVLWKVQVDPQRAVVERTPFVRYRIEPDPYYYYPPPRMSFGLGLGWGPYWWYDPLFYPPLTFYQPVVVGRPYPVYVHRPPPTYGHPVMPGAPAPSWRATPPAPAPAPRSISPAPVPGPALGPRPMPGPPPPRPR